MERFDETKAGARFLASGASRETSREVMEAIAFFARNFDEADAIWNGDAIGKACTLLGIWEHATNNGTDKNADLCWGDSGEDWAAEFVM